MDPTSTETQIVLEVVYERMDEYRTKLDASPTSLERHIYILVLGVYQDLLERLSLD